MHATRICGRRRPAVRAAVRTAAMLGSSLGMPEQSWRGGARATPLGRVSIQPFRRFSAGPVRLRSGGEPRRTQYAVRNLPLDGALAGSQWPRVLAPPPLGLAPHVENHRGQRLAQPGDLLRAFAAVPPGCRVGARLDTGHPLSADADPVLFARHLGPWLGHVHLKDAHRALLPPR